MRGNVWSRFRALTPQPPLLVGTIQAVMAAGARRVVMPSGAVVTVTGDAAEGSRVFFRDGAIQGPAPELATVEIEV